ncbi:MAG: GFA family protein [Dichotomicrobium sp.]
MAAGNEVTGRCLCGAVRYTATLNKREVDACHCTMCRRWSGGPLLNVETNDDMRFENAERVATYRASEWGERGFCRDCGTHLFWRMQDGSHVALSVGTLDDDTGLALTSEIFIDEKPAYYEFANATTRLTGQQVFEMFGASEEKD